ncbi:hypothetical protein BC332_30677 [Capsicum chinense]|nr:hypothetical protein BC332_30677 [Capsicum chinense]
MEKVMRMVVFGALAVATLLQVTTAQKEHVVGDNIGWVVPPTGASAYSTWASKNTFNVGDTLVFKFPSNIHNVQEVTKASFDECSTKFTRGPAISIGPANVTLKSAGDKYYICTVGKHCIAGQKLAIIVSGTGAPISNAPKGSATPSPTPTPHARAESSPPSPAPSSSTVVLTSFLLSASSIALAIFF